MSQRPYRALAASLVLAAGCTAATNPAAILKHLGDAALAPPTATPPDSVDALDLEAALSLARQWHPRLHIARARVAEARGTWDQSGRWENPELELEAQGGAHNRAAGFGADAEFAASLAWSLPIYSGRSARAEAARQELLASDVEVGAEVQAVEADVRRAFARSLAAERGATLATSSLAMAREGFDNATRRRDAGEAPATEFLRAKIEFDLAEGAQTAAFADRIAARRALAASLGLPGLEIQAVAGELRTTWPVVSPRRIADRAAEWAPSLKVAAAHLAASRANVVATDREGWPEPELRVGLATERVAGDREWLVEWGLGIPIPVFDRNRGAVAAAQAHVLQATAESRAAHNAVQAAVLESTSAYTLARDQVLRYREHILPHAEEALEIVRSGFPEEFNQIELIDAQRTLAEARSEWVRRLRTLAEAAVALEVLTGEPLDALAAATEEKR